MRENTSNQVRILTARLQVEAQLVNASGSAEYRRLHKREAPNVATEPGPNPGSLTEYLAKEVMTLR
jgi:hypothetical protein